MKKSFLFTGKEIPICKLVPKHKVHHSRSVLRSAASSILQSRGSVSLSALNKTADQIDPPSFHDMSMRRRFIPHKQHSHSTHQLPRVNKFIKEWGVKNNRIAIVGSKTKKLRLVPSSNIHIKLR